MDSPNITSTILCFVFTKSYNTCTYFVNDPSTFQMREKFTHAAVETAIRSDFLDLMVESF
jgi:hypothetical protein